jgi:antibiotic biosynthesis monooxygenase (ABM) superfamily enzyme
MPTLLIKRLIKRGHEKEYENILQDLIQHSEHMDGYMGINVVRSSDKENPLYIFTARFDTKENLDKFKSSSFRHEALKRIHDISQAPIRERTISKHDWWFALPGAHYDIPRYKMVVVTIFAAYPVVLGVNIYNNGIDNFGTLALRTLIAVTITIATISYITMPIFLSIFRKWINSSDEYGLK